MARPLRCMITIGLLAAGIAFVLLVKPDWPFGGSELLFATVFAAVTALVPAVRRAGIKAFGRLRTLSPRQRLIGSAVVAAAWFVLVLATNTLQHRSFQLLWHDEHQFHLQSRMLASGRLWMPPHELTDSLDTFYVLITPKYAPQSFPGAALMFVPGIWLNLPNWVMPLIVCAVAMGLLWWVLSELVDPAGATIALVALFGSPEMRVLGTMTLAQVPALLLGLVAVAAWLKYRQTRRAAWVLLIGVALGWCLITRPLDAACYISVIGVAVIAVWVRCRSKHIAIACLLGVVGALPFVTLQLVFNHAITGTITKAPFTFYNERDQPALAYGGAGDLSRRPISNVPQKQWFYDFFTMTYVKQAQEGPAAHLRDRVATIYPMLTPGMWALPLAFVGMAGLVAWRRWAVFALLPLFVVAYGQYPIYAFHYIAFAMPAVALLYALGPGVIARCLPEHLAAGAPPITAAGVFGFALGCIYLNLPEPDAYSAHDIENRSIASALNKVARPAIVLFQAYEPGMNMHEEPVYNDDVVWPDDAPVIRAHFLPDANAKLFAYYAARQPQRRVYVFDRRTMRMRTLGNVADLAKQFPTTRP